ncbi:MAG: PadR family transcriptional regulator [Oscillospiraceae bacterium]
MIFPISSTLLDACVLGIVNKEATYGYNLTLEIQETVNVSESTIYPVLRRLLKEGYVISYDKSFDGRNRRYYEITDCGKDKLYFYKNEWKIYKENINKLISGGDGNE